MLSLSEQRDRACRRAGELEVEMLRLKLELERDKKWYYGPRADRLQEAGDVAQMLLDFAGTLEARPVPAEELAEGSEEATEVRRVLRRGAERDRRRRELAGGVCAGPL